MILTSSTWAFLFLPVLRFLPTPPPRMRRTKDGLLAAPEGSANETRSTQELEVSEHITVHRMPADEARRTLLDQECGDGQSMAALMLLDRWLAAGNAL